MEQQAYTICDEPEKFWSCVCFDLAQQPGPSLRNLQALGLSGEFRLAPISVTGWLLIVGATLAGTVHR